jgi:hypothetical protein
MRMFGVAVILAGALLGSVAHAQSPNPVQPCADQAKQQKLRGAPLADFLTKCVNTHATPMPMGDLSSRCRTEAQRHALSGEELIGFMKRCEAGQVVLPTTASGPPTCDERARVRALSGEALTTFMRRCQAGQI